MDILRIFDEKSEFSCSHETKNEFPLGKLVSISNNQTIELSVVSEEELSKYFDELASNKDIPFLYAYDGCYARAHKMSQILESKGIITGNAFVFKLIDKYLYGDQS
jgi:hypothetical protein